MRCAEKKNAQRRMGKEDLPTLWKADDLPEMVIRRPPVIHCDVWRQKNQEVRKQRKHGKSPALSHKELTRRHHQGARDKEASAQAQPESNADAQNQPICSNDPRDRSGGDRSDRRSQTPWIMTLKNEYAIAVQLSAGRGRQTNGTQEIRRAKTLIAKAEKQSAEILRELWSVKEQVREARGMEYQEFASAVVPLGLRHTADRCVSAQLRRCKECMTGVATPHR